MRVWLTVVMMTGAIALSSSWGCSKEPKHRPTSTNEAATPTSPQANAAAPSGAPGAAAPARVAHLASERVISLFPSTLAGFSKGGFKLKKNSDAFYEFKATYKGSAGEVKVVINDWIDRDGAGWKPTMWTEAIAATGQTTKGYPSMVEPKGDKVTLMVMVSSRIRVDFKSRDVGKTELGKLAADFDLAAVAGLGQQRGD